MVKLFKTNNPACIAVIVVYVMLLRLILLFKGADTTLMETSPDALTSLLHGFVSKLPFSSLFVYYPLSVLVVSLQAMLVNKVVHDFRVFDRFNYMPAFVFALTASLVPNFILFSPQVIASTFIIWAVYKLYSAYGETTFYSRILDAGLFVGLAALFYFPYLGFAFFALIGLASVRSTNTREMIVLVIGVLLPFVFCGSVYYLMDGFSNWTNQLLDAYLSALNLSFDLSIPSIVMLSCGTILFMVAAFQFQTLFNKQLIHVRKFMSLQYLLLIVALATFIIRGGIGFEHLVIIAFPLSIFIARMLRDIKRAWIAEAIHVFLIMSIIFVQYLENF